MEILPLASESWPGVRSSSVLVRTPDASIVIDPGCALGPSRYGLPPHRLEWEALDLAWKAISSALEGSDVVIITHYHYDHLNPDHPEILRGKTLLVKDPEKAINFNQRRRAGEFLRGLEFSPADGKTFRFGETELVFSGPLPHGQEGSKTGWVISVAIKRGKESFLYASDVGGIQTESQFAFIAENRPRILYIDGPLTYMGIGDLGTSVGYLSRVITDVRPEIIILEHHLLRDLNWEAKVLRVLELASSVGTSVRTAAGFSGKPDNLLEARRAELYRGDRGP
ncbi:MAG: MBL fold metallo-hydrolase [candidate division WOR-3 bacterium]